MTNSNRTQTKPIFPTFSKLFDWLLSTFSKLFDWLFSWRTIRRLLITSAVVVTLIVLFYTVELVRGKWAWDKYVAETEARGEPLDFAALIPPPVPDDENFAMIPLFRDSFKFKPPFDSLDQPDWGPYFEASKKVRLLPRFDGNWIKGERIDLSGWQKYYRSEDKPEADEKVPTSENPQSPAEDVLLALTVRKDVLDQLKGGSHRRYARFPIDYNANFAAVLPHLKPMKDATLTLKQRALAHLALGNVNLAHQDVMLGFYLRDVIESEPLLISLVLRIAEHSIMIHPVWEGIADGKWNENQLKEFQELFEGDNWLADFKQTMRGERAFSIIAMDIIVGSSENYAFFFSSYDGGSPLAHFLFPRGWIFQNKLSICRWEEPFLSNTLDEKNMTLDMEQINNSGVENGNRKNSPYNIFARMIAPALSASALRSARAQTVSDRAAIACAIERYRLAIGSLPKTLDQLVPGYMETLPHDVINGKPLNYKQEGNSRYLLYSVGANQTDDGGRFDDDWVWLYQRNSEINK